MTNFTVDTNILIYSVDPTDPVKHSIAKALMTHAYSRGGVLPLQCLSEFYAACTRKRLAPVEIISEVVNQAIQSMQIAPSSPADLIAAMQLHQRYNLQFFDALIIATARNAGCHTLFTEDMQSGRTLEGISLLNPFLLTPEERNDLLS